MVVRKFVVSKCLSGRADVFLIVADFLAPEYQGRGIMSAAIGTLVNHWLVPIMGARKIVVAAMTTNHASRRVFEKNSFRLVDTLEDCKVMPVSKGGMKYGIHVLAWEGPQSEGREAGKGSE